jgi:hypothetical protein
MPKSAESGAATRQPDPPHQATFVYERILATLTAISIIAVALYLVIRPEPFSEPNKVVIFRIILSLAMGIIGATIPGFLRVSYDFKGLRVRAVGGFAFGIVAFFGTPKVEPLQLNSPAVMKIEGPSLIDIRTSEGPDAEDSARLNAPPYVTVNMSYRNAAEPSRAGHISGSKIEVPLNGTDHRFHWVYFVNMHPERHESHLGIDTSATPKSVAAGEVLTLEVMHKPEKALRWIDVLDELQKPEGKLAFSVITRIDEKDWQSSCTVDRKVWASQIKRFMDGNAGRVPPYITMCCLESPATVVTPACMGGSPT